MELSYTRGKILSIIKEKQPISITDLSKELKLAGGTTIHRYVEELKQRGLITAHKENKKRGKPTMLSVTNKADPMPYAMVKALEKFKIG